MNSETDIFNNYVILKMSRILTINANELNTNFNNNLLNILKNEVGGCKNEGYIDKESVKIINIGKLFTEVIRYRGSVRVKVDFTANVLNPLKDDIIQCKIKRKNQFGLMAIAGPINIVIPLDNINVDESKINIGETVKVKVVKSEIILNSNEINIFATYFDESKENSKPKENKQNKVSKKTVNDTDYIGDESDENIEESDSEPVEEVLKQNEYLDNILPEDDEVSQEEDEDSDILPDEEENDDKDDKDDKDDEDDEDDGDDGDDGAEKSEKE